MVPPSLDLSLLRTFVDVVETGNLTESAKRLRMTQPAVSQQLRRLEEAVRRALFTASRRPKTLTKDGEILHGYAMAMLRLHDEAVARFTRSEITGRIVLGSPDLYASFLLPAILADFAAAYPTIQIDLRCDLTRPLLQDYAAGRLDVLLVTDMPRTPPGHFVRKEPLFFVTGETSEAQRQTPIPLAMLPQGNLYRDYAIAALEAYGRPWRIACESESIAGLLASVQAGLAVTVLTEPAVGHGYRICSGFDGVPNLPGVNLVLHYRQDDPESPAAHLARFMMHRLVTGRGKAPAVTGAL